MKGVIELLNKEIEKINKKLENISPYEEEMIEIFEEELESLNYKKELCISLMEKAYEDKQIEEESLQTKYKNIIFATTESGNVCFESDLKTIPEEFLESFSILLNKLKRGEIETNPEKSKNFNNNKKMSKIHELKDFKVRLFYKNLSPDTVYVLMARMKKSTNVLLDRKEIIERSNQRKTQYDRLNCDIKNPEIKEKLIQEHQEKFYRILEQIEQKKR